MLSVDTTHTPLGIWCTVVRLLIHTAVGRDGATWPAHSRCRVWLDVVPVAQRDHTNSIMKASACMMNVEAAQYRGAAQGLPNVCRFLHPIGRLLVKSDGRPDSATHLTSNRQY